MFEKKKFNIHKYCSRGGGVQTLKTPTLVVPPSIGSTLHRQTDRQRKQMLHSAVYTGIRTFFFDHGGQQSFDLPPEKQKTKKDT